MKHLRAFIAGIALPSVLVPFFLYLAIYLGKPQVLDVPFLHVLPLVWGIWNILYFAFFRNFIPASVDVRLLVTGAVLGLLVAFCGIFWLHVPDLLGLAGSYRYIPLIVGPVVYAVLWRYIVKPLNVLVGLEEG